MKGRKNIIVSGGLKLNKQKPKPKKKKAPIEPKPLEIPKRPPRKPVHNDFRELIPIDSDLLNAIALNLSRAQTWRERQQHLISFRNFYLTYNQLSIIVHRLPTFEERMKTMIFLKDQVHDSEHSFYLFSQSFALHEERVRVSELFEIPLNE